MPMGGRSSAPRISSAMAGIGPWIRSRAGPAGPPPCGFRLPAPAWSGTGILLSGSMAVSLRRRRHLPGAHRIAQMRDAYSRDDLRIAQDDRRAGKAFEEPDSGTEEHRG